MAKTTKLIFNIHLNIRLIFKLMLLKISSRWLGGLHVEGIMIPLLEENIFCIFRRKYRIYHSIGKGKIFLMRIPKAPRKKKMYKITASV